ncbi:Chitinase A1 [Hypsizygus marmoreus]|uniref:Chitinase A1 n=1 Tax=Hypsizygus marmoreus TaxID=39966 RepID=A0A369JBB4_HYPMA|nr:Chitinase A1 [Hypsizygus marmoreus]
MARIKYISILDHTTASSPTPHVLYIIKVTFDNGQQHEVLRRYSQFVGLHEYLEDSFTLPPNHHLTNAVVPSAWVNDELIAERKSGLAAYLTHVNTVPEFQDNPIYVQFLSSPSFDMDSLGQGAKETPNMVSRDTVKIYQVIASDPDTQATPIAAAYYPSWSAWTNPPNKLNFAKFDIIFYAFATPNASATLSWEGGAQDTLRKLISSARQSGKGTKIVLSVGGWGGSYWFSQVVSSSANRSKFNNALVGAVNSFGLDGIDIDWEYPNSTGAGNPHSSADAANFLSLLKLLRTSLGWSKVISAAVPHMPWLGANGSPLTNVSAYAAQMTYVNIMNYDVNGASSKPGPNAPLGNLCGTSKQPQANAKAALAQWTKAGFPASKLLLGLPLYGYVSKSTATKLSGSLMPDPSVSPSPHPRNGPPRTLEPDAAAGDLSGMWGQQIAFNQLLQGGALVKNADGTYKGANGYQMGWDNCSDTPFLYNTARSTVVSYDDTWSIASKTQFAKKASMAGCFTWSLDQDDGLALHNVIRSNLGKK